MAMIGGRADVVMSDMAANTTGHRKTDQLRIVGLVEDAAAFACDVLKPGGTFVAKVFQSGADADADDAAEARFRQRPPRQAGGQPARIPPSAMCWRLGFRGGQREHTDIDW